MHRVFTTRGTRPKWGHMDGSLEELQFQKNHTALVKEVEMLRGLLEKKQRRHEVRALTIDRNSLRKCVAESKAACDLMLCKIRKSGNIGGFTLVPNQVVVSLTRLRSQLAAEESLTLIRETKRRLSP